MGAAIVRDALALVEAMRQDKYAAVVPDLEHVTFIDGRACFSGPKTIEVNGQRLAAERFVIATGSTRPRLSAYSFARDISKVSCCIQLCHEVQLQVRARQIDLIIGKAQRHTGDRRAGPTRPSLSVRVV